MVRPKCSAALWGSRLSGLSKVSTAVSPDSTTRAVTGPGGSKPSGRVNADGGTICLGVLGLSQRSRMFEPPQCSKNSSLKSYARPASSAIGVPTTSTSQSSTQWSMTSRPSIHSR